VVATENEDCCEVLMEPHLWWHSKHTAYSSAQAPQSPDWACISEEQDDVQSRPDPPTHNRHKNCSACCPLDFRREKYTNLLGAPEDRMRVKHRRSGMKRAATSTGCFVWNMIAQWHPWGCFNYCSYVLSQLVSWTLIPQF
jgi:hypothetical protein